MPKYECRFLDRMITVEASDSYAAERAAMSQFADYRAAGYTLNITVSRAPEPTVKGT